MGTAIRRAVFPALLAAAAVLAGTVSPARAELTPEQAVRLLEAKNSSQKTQADAVRILDGSQDPDARRAAQQVIENCQRTYNVAEALLTRNQGSG